MTYTNKVVNGVEIPLTAEEIAEFQAQDAAWEATGKYEAEWAKIRRDRNKLLVESDWTDLPNSPVSNKMEWLGYRQFLRDMTKQSDPFKIVWPLKPQ